MDDLMAKKMNVLILGGGGREHAMAWSVFDDQRARAGQIFCAPGNAGIAEIATCVELDIKNPQAVLDFVRANSIDITIVGPEDPLALGVVDVVRTAGYLIVGPTKAAAQLETSKIFARELMAAAGVPQPKFIICADEAEAKKAQLRFGFPVVLKADGLAAGKGVIVCRNEYEFDEGLKDMFVDKKFGAASHKILVEECLVGEELSVFPVCDHNANYLLIGSAQDHKRLFDKDEGPNTGGMGAYSPTPLETPELMAKIKVRIIEPTLREMASRDMTYTGFLYVGIMIVKDEPYVIEYNVRSGDPETQVLLPRMESSFLQLMLDAAEGKLDQHQLKMSDEPIVIVTLAAKGYPDKYEKGLPIRIPVDHGHLITHFHAGTTMKDGQLVSNGGRVLGVIGIGKNLAEAISCAYGRIYRSTWFKDCHYRTDIGKRGLKYLKQKEKAI